MKRKLSISELASTPVAQLFPPISSSIFGDWDEQIKTIDQAKNVLTVADIARDVGAKLNLTDLAIETKAYNFLTKKRN